MEVVSWRRDRNGVVSGSIWENRMKLDQVKVYTNSDEAKNNDEENSEMGPKSNLVMSGKRKTWKSDSSQGVSRKRAELDEHCKEVSVPCGDAMKKSPMQSKKTRPSHEYSGTERSPVKTIKAKSVNDKNSELRKVKSLSADGSLRNSLQLVKAKSASSKELEVNGRNCNGVVKSSLESKRSNFDENKNADESKKKTRSEDDSKEFGVVCEDKLITSNVEAPIKCPPEEELNLVNEEDNDEEIEKGSVDVKEISVEEKKSEMVIEEKKLHLSNERSEPISPIIKKQPTPISGQARVHHPSPTRTKSVPSPDEFQRTPRHHSRLESFVDLVMWRDVSKSALIFGIGTFVIISSSYTQDLKISFISVLSYLGLFYLAAIFLFRSLTHRVSNDIEDEYVVGEEEVMWLLRLMLPYINECLLKIRALFSGDPATTIKMAIVLFILARCGSSITIWKMSRLGFFGVFIVPKLCSSYSAQFTAYGTFWIRRFRDAWESCTHKKAVAFAIFTIMWNLSSFAARIWAVFMLYVGFKYYQQKMIKEGWVGEEATAKPEDCWQNKIEVQRQVGRRSNLMESRKQKKKI